MSGFNYLYATRGAEAAYNYLDKAAGQTYTGAEAVALGALEATGLSSLSAAIGGGISRLTGDGEMAERNSRWYNGLTADAAAAQEQHPAAYGAGSVGGNLALMYGTGAALGAVEGALSAGAGIGGKTVQLTLSPAVQSIVNGALTFAAADAVQNAGSAATGRITGTDYLKSLGISGAQGVAGGAAGSLVGSGLAEVLRKSGLQTPFMEFVRQTAQGLASSGANIGTGYALSEKKPDREQVATDLATAFLLSVLQSGISTYRTTTATRAQLEQAVETVGEQYGRMSQGWERMTPEARAQAAENILRQTQILRSELNSTYLAGQQSTVNQMNAALDGIEAAMQGYISGFSGAPAAAPASPSGSGSGVKPGLVPVSRLAGGVTGQPASPLPAGAAAAMAPAKPTARQNNTASSGEAASTAVDTNPARHTAAEQAVIDAYQAAVDDNLANFVETALENKGSNRGKYTLKPVSARATADIKALTGIDTSGFKTVLEQRIAEHIVERHGANGAADTSMQDINDIARMQYVLDNYDSMEPAGYTRAYTTNKPNGRPGQAKTVKYIKAVNGTYYIIEAVPDTKAKTTFIVSAYMSNKKAGESQTTDANAPAWTAKPENATTPALISIISENPAGGNARSARNRAGVTAVGDEYLQQALEEAWNGADGPSVRGPQEDGIHTLEAVDRRPAGLYDGKKEVGIYGQQGAGPADIGTLYGGPVWENAQEADAGRVREDTQAPGALPAGETGAKSVADWAKGYVRKVGSDHPAEQAAVITRAYSPNVVVIADHALRKRRNNALATTSNGTVYISDAIPADLAEPIGYHEAVHAVRQRGDAEYLEFVENLGRYLDIGNQQMEGFLELISEGKAYQQKDFFDLSMEELDDLFDELNALVWGYHKVSPEHAREQFGGIFTNYEAYIEELDAIMERARQRNEVGQSGYRERPGISIERILEEGWRDEAPSVRGPEEGAFSEENQLPGRSGAKDFGSEAVPVKEGATFRTEIPEYTEAVNSSISRAGKYAVEQGAKRQGEYLILVDTRTGTWLYEEAGDEVSVGNTEAFRRFVREHPDGRFAYVHAHPSGRGLSLNDMAEFFGDDQFESMVAAGYNGKVYAVYGKRAKISAWQEIMRPSVDAALGEDLRRQLRDDKINTQYFKHELERRRVQYLIDHYCSAWEAET